MDNKIDPCDTMRVNLIAAAVGLQQCTKTESNIVHIPGGDRVIAIGTPTQVRALLPKPAMPPELQAAITEAAQTRAAGAVLPDDSAVFINYGDQPEDTEHLNCTACGGSGHIDDLIPAARDVLAERRRQVEAEGWTPEHDDAHGDGSMARAAACYAAINSKPVPSMWPWAPDWWKPRDARVNYVRAAALLLAEIERIDRAAMSASKGNADDRLTAEERAFVELVRQRPGRKLNGPEAYDVDGNPLWKRPEELGLIQTVGSYKWVVPGAAPLTSCAANRDGECGHTQCPQLRDGEPRATGRHCPLDSEGGRHD